MLEKIYFEQKLFNFRKLCAHTLRVKWIVLLSATGVWRRRGDKVKHNVTVAWRWPRSDETSHLKTDVNVGRDT